MPQCQFPVFCYFWFQKVTSGNILGIARNKRPSPYFSSTYTESETETSVLRNLSSMAAALRNSSWNMTWCFRVFASRGINRRRGDVGGPPRGPNHRQARWGPLPRHLVVWPPRGSPSSLLRTPCTCWKNRDLAFCFVQFRECFQK